MPDYSTQNQMLLVGEVAGALAPSFDSRLEADARGNYTGRIFIERPSGRWAVTVAPAPIQERVVCPTCGGDGGDLDDSSKVCDECDGHGKVWRDVPDA
jgi:hypothetical protein